MNELRRWGWLLVLALCALPAALQAQTRGERGEIASFGNDIVIAAGETASDVACFLCSVKVKGTVTGDIAAFWGSVEVSGTVNGDIAAFLGGVKLNDNSEVKGDIAAFGGAVERDPGARVGGKVVAFGNVGALLALLVVTSIVITLVLVAICYAIAGERRVGTIAAVVREQAGMSLLAGLGVCVGAVVLIILFAFMGPAAPLLIIVLALALALTSLVGFTGLSSWMGTAVAKGAGPFTAVMLGALLLTLIQLVVPLLGILAGLIFAFLGLGSALLSGWGAHPNWLTQRMSSAPAAPPGSGPPTSIGP
jgi:hypothetical protein